MDRAIAETSHIEQIFDFSHSTNFFTFLAFLYEKKGLLLFNLLQKIFIYIFLKSAYSNVLPDSS